jgi:HK97 family phage major capsid protein
MSFNNIVSRQDMAPLLVPEAVSTAMLDDVTYSSAALSLGRRIAMPSASARFPIRSALPVANFVNGDTGQKQTTELSFDNRFMYVEEIAAIVVVPDAVAEDASFDLWGEIRSQLADAFAAAIDAAIFLGAGKPASWPKGLIEQAKDAGNVVTRGAAAQKDGGLAEDINQLMAKVEQDGYDVNRFVAHRTFRARVRGARATDGQRLLDFSNGSDSIEGVGVSYGLDSVLIPGAGEAETIAGDFRRLIIGIRREMEAQMFTEGIIQDATGAITFNLLQQDLAAIRATMRLAWEVAAPLNRANFDRATRFPFSVLLAP